MKRYNDHKIYFGGAAASILVAIFICLLSLYSVVFVEPEVKKLIAADKDISQNYKKAYLILREPQLFAGYRHFDAEALSITNSLMHFDRKIYNGEDIDQTASSYLQIIADRRTAGSRLGLYTSVFFLIVSLVFAAAFIHEKKTSAKS